MLCPDRHKVLSVCTRHNDHATIVRRLSFFAPLELVINHYSKKINAVKPMSYIHNCTMDPQDSPSPHSLCSFGRTDRDGRTETDGVSQCAHMRSRPNTSSMQPHHMSQCPYFWNLRLRSSRSNSSSPICSSRSSVQFTSCARRKPASLLWIAFTSLGGEVRNPAPPCACAACACGTACACAACACAAWACACAACAGWWYVCWYDGWYGGGCWYGW